MQIPRLNKPINKLKDLILERVLLSDVLQEYNVEFMYDPSKADEVQFRCPIHGKDNKPSARFYKATQTCYCWFCQKRWDVINFIKDKENLNYYETISYIVNKYQLDTSSLPDVDLEIATPRIATEDDLKMQKIQENVFIKEIRRKIKTHRGPMPLDKYRSLCGAFYMVLFEKNRGVNVLPNLIKFDKKLNKVTNG